MKLTLRAVLLKSFARVSERIRQANRNFLFINATSLSDADGLVELLLENVIAGETTLTLNEKHVIHSV